MTTSIQRGIPMISQQDFEAALESHRVKHVAQQALNQLQSKGWKENTAASALSFNRFFDVAVYDWAIQAAIGDERLTYAEYGAVVHLLGNPWMLESRVERKC